MVFKRTIRFNKVKKYVGLVPTKNLVPSTKPLAGVWDSLLHLPRSHQVKISS